MGQAGAWLTGYPSILYMQKVSTRKRFKQIVLEQRAALTISDLNIQDDGMLIACDVGIFAESPGILRQLVQVGFDKTSVKVYGEQLPYQN